MSYININIVLGHKALVHLGNMRSKFAPHEEVFIIVIINNNGTMQAKKRPGTMVNICIICFAKIE